MANQRPVLGRGVRQPCQTGDPEKQAVVAPKETKLMCIAWHHEDKGINHCCLDRHEDEKVNNVLEVG